MSEEQPHAWWRDPWWQQALIVTAVMESPVLGERCRQCDTVLTRNDGQRPKVRVHVCRRCRQANVDRLRGKFRG